MTIIASSIVDCMDCDYTRGNSRLLRESTVTRSEGLQIAELGCGVVPSRCLDGKRPKKNESTQQDPATATASMLLIDITRPIPIDSRQSTPGGWLCEMGMAETAERTTESREKGLVCRTLLLVESRLQGFQEPLDARRPHGRTAILC